LKKEGGKPQLPSLLQQLRAKTLQIPKNLRDVTFLFLLKQATHLLSQSAYILQLKYEKAHLTLLVLRIHHHTA